MTSLKQGEPLSSLSLSKSQQYVAVGCGQQVELMRLGEETFCATMQLQSSGRFTVTDVAFNPILENFVAASATNGMVAVFDVNHTSGQKRVMGRSRWDSIEAPRSINKVNWHPSDDQILISAGMDGVVRLFDLREKSRKGTLYSTKTEATRDVQINPFDASMFAAISENGVLSIWDQRNNDMPVSKINAHTMSGLSVSWNPSFRGVIATGSRDKTVKVWDLGHSASNKSGSVISSNFLRLSTANNEDLASKLGNRPVTVIHTPSSVGRIRWRKTDKFADQLATVSTGADTYSGEILVWSVNKPNMPICILKAHGADPCSDFAWLDTPSSPAGPPSERSANSNSVKGNSEQQTRQHKQHEQSEELMGIYQHVLSVGKDGSMFVQDLRSSFFPRGHLSPSVTAISSQGHVAFQRGRVDRTDPIGLVHNDITKRAPKLFISDPASFGIAQIPDTFKVSDPIIAGKNREGKKVEGPRKSLDESTSQNEGTGAVFFGLAEIKNLVEAQEIRGVRGAEGGAFDPAVVALLARTYKLGDGQGNACALEACESNLRTAKESGLQCRATIWSTVLALLSEKSEQAGLVTNAGAKSAILGGVVSYTKSERSQTTSKLSESTSPDDGNNEGCGEGKGGKTTSQHKRDQRQKVKLPARLPFCAEILGFLLQELLDGGDCQHFVVLCEVLECADSDLLEQACVTSNISSMQRREAYLAYFDLLGRLKLFCAANKIIKGSKEDYISKITRHGVVMHTSCSTCGKELQESSLSSWCTKCNRSSSLCSLCHQPVSTMMHWCPVCGHGGHRACLDKWFARYNTCPTGCGHNCCNFGGKTKQLTEVRLR